MKDSSGKDGEYEQFQHVVLQKDGTIAEKEQQLRQCREELTQQIRQLEMDKYQIIQQLERERDQVIQEKERQLGRVNQQLKESERLIADFGKQNTKLEEQLSVLRKQVQEKDGGANSRGVDMANIKLRWREGEKAPCCMGRSCDAVRDNNTVYYKHGMTKKVYAYHIPSSNWSLIPDCPADSGFALTVIDGLLTAIGGRRDGKNTDKLFSLTGEGSDRKWTEEFPPMPTKHRFMAALCTGTALIIAGGFDDDNQVLKTVEVLNTETRQWHTAPDLPQPLAQSSLTLCGGLLYLLGGFTKITPRFATNSVYSCSLSSLLSFSFKSLGGRLVSTLTQSRGKKWNRVADLPIKLSTAVTLHGQLLAIGGWDSTKDKSTPTIHMYQPSTNSWEVFSHMITPRSTCVAAVLPDNQLMVVGGWITKNKECDSVEFGRV